MIRRRRGAAGLPSDSCASLQIPPVDAEVPLDVSSVHDGQVGTPWPSAIRVREWVDAAGTRWRMRGTPAALTTKRAERLIHLPDALVLHFYGPDEPVEVPLPDRAELWERVHPYLRAQARSPGDHTDFRLAEFRDEHRRVLIAVEESC